MREWTGTSQRSPLLHAVARAIDANDGEPVSPEMVNAQLEQSLDEQRLDRRLGELLKGEFIAGTTIEGLDAPVSISLAARGRGQVSGWPGASLGGGVSISESTIGNLALRDINITNVDVANFFEAWEQQVEELDAPPEEKQAAREKLRMAKDILTGAAGGAGGRALYEAFPVLFG
jgi:hypothetical protein